MKHSQLLGGSSASRRIACAGSYKLEQSVQTPSAESAYAARGTALHEATTANLLDAEGSHPSTLIGQTFYGRVISEEDVNDAIIPAIQHIDQIIAQAGGECDIWVELEVTLFPETSETPGSFGTLDVLVRSDTGHFWLVDFKFGEGVSVEVKDSKQLLFYAAALAADPRDTGYTAEAPLTLAIIQPNDTHRAELSVLRLWEVETGRVAQMGRECKAAITQALTATMIRSDFTMGDHCMWCKAVAICPAQMETSQALVDTQQTVQWAHVTGDVLGDMLEKASHVENFIAELRKYAHALLENNNTLAPVGWKLVPKKAMRKWSDEDRVAKELSKRIGEKNAYTRKLASPAQVEKIIKKGDLKLTKRVFDAKLKPLISQDSSGTNMVKEDNPKTGIEPTQNIPQLTGPSILNPKQ